MFLFPDTNKYGKHSKKVKFSRKIFEFFLHSDIRNRQHHAYLSCYYASEFKGGNRSRNRLIGSPLRAYKPQHFLIINFQNGVGVSGSGIMYLNAQIFAKSSKKEFENRTPRSTENPRRTTSTGVSSFQNLKNGHFWSPLKKWGSKKRQKRVQKMSKISLFEGKQQIIIFMINPNSQF